MRMSRKYRAGDGPEAIGWLGLRSKEREGERPKKRGQHRNSLWTPNGPTAATVAHLRTGICLGLSGFGTFGG